MCFMVLNLLTQYSLHTFQVAQSSSGNVSGPWLHRFVYDPSYAEWYGTCTV